MRTPPFLSFALLSTIAVVSTGGCSHASADDAVGVSEDDLTALERSFGNDGYVVFTKNQLGGVAATGMLATRDDHLLVALHRPEFQPRRTSDPKLRRR